MLRVHGGRGNYNSGWEICMFPAFYYTIAMMNILQNSLDLFCARIFIITCLNPGFILAE